MEKHATPPHANNPLIDHMPMLRRLARHLSDSPDQAEDLTQDCLLQVWARLRAGQDIVALRPYLMATLRNLHRQRLRGGVTHCALDETDLPQSGEALRSLACSDVLTAISRLPQDQAVLVQLVATGETSPATLAQLTGVPVGTVMSRLARARQTLRVAVGLEDGMDVISLFDTAPD